MRTHRLEVGHGNGPSKSLGGQRQHIGDLGSVAKVMVKIIGHGQRDFRAVGDTVGFKVRQGWGVGCHLGRFGEGKRDGRGSPAGRNEKMSRHAIASRAGYKTVWPSQISCQPKRGISYQFFSRW